MQSLSEKKRQAMREAIEGVLECLNEAPFKSQFHGVYATPRHMAERILKEIEQVEIDYANKYQEARELTRD